MPAQATKSEATVIRAPDQRLRNIIEIQGPQNIQNSQSTIGSPLNTTHNTEKNTPRSEHSLINPSQKVKFPVSKIPLLMTKDTTRNNIDQRAKKLTIEQGRGHSPLTKRQERRGYNPLTKRQGGRGHSPQPKRQERRGYRPQKDKGYLGGNKSKNYPLGSRFLSKAESWKK